MRPAEETLVCPICLHVYRAELGAYCSADDAPLLLPDVHGTIPDVPLMGQVVASFRLLGLIGESRSGLLYRARHQRIPREVVVKILRPELTARAELAHTILSAGQAVARLSHWAIGGPRQGVRPPGDEGPAYLTMDRMRGQPLSDWPVDDIEGLCAVTLVVLEALTEAAAKGVRHLHLTPSKIFVDRPAEELPRPQIFDFGLAGVPYILWHRLGLLDTTNDPFFAPEYRRGGAVDDRADIFSLGTVLASVLSGGQSFTAQNIPPSVPEGLRKIIRQACRFAPIDRFKTFAAMRDAISAFQHSYSKPGGVPLLVSCSACDENDAGGPSWSGFEQAAASLTSALTRTGLIEREDSSGFYRVLQRGEVTLCVQADDPAHVMRSCTACGATLSVSIPTLDALRFCPMCSHAIKPLALEPMIHSVAPNIGTVVFDPRTGLCALTAEQLKVYIYSEAGLVQPSKGILWMQSEDCNSPPWAEIHTPKPLHSGLLRVAPSTRRNLPPTSVPPQELSTHAIWFEEWPKRLPLKPVSYTLRLQSEHGQHTVLETFEVRPLFHFRTLIQTRAGSQKLDGLPISLREGVPFVIRLVASQAFPDLEQINLEAQWGGSAWPFTVESHHSEGRELLFKVLPPDGISADRSYDLVLALQFAGALRLALVSGRVVFQEDTRPAPPIRVKLTTDRDGESVILGEGRDACLHLRTFKRPARFFLTPERILPSNTTITVLSDDLQVVSTRRTPDGTCWELLLDFEGEGPWQLKIELKARSVLLILRCTLDLSAFIKVIAVWSTEPPIAERKVLSRRQSKISFDACPNHNSVELRLQMPIRPTTVEVWRVDGQEQHVGTLELRADCSRRLTVEVPVALEIRPINEANSWRIFLPRANSSSPPLQLVNDAPVPLSRDHSSLVDVQTQSTPVTLVSATPSSLDVSVLIDGRPHRLNDRPFVAEINSEVTLLIEASGDLENPDDAQVEIWALGHELPFTIPLDYSEITELSQTLRLGGPIVFVPAKEGWCAARFLDDGWTTVPCHDPQKIIAKLLPRVVYAVPSLASPPGWDTPFGSVLESVDPHRAIAAGALCYEQPPTGSIRVIVLETDRTSILTVDPSRLGEPARFLKPKTLTIGTSIGWNALSRSIAEHLAPALSTVAITQQPTTRSTPRRSWQTRAQGRSARELVWQQASSDAPTGHQESSAAFSALSAALHRQLIKEDTPPSKVGGIADFDVFIDAIRWSDGTALSETERAVAREAPLSSEGVLAAVRVATESLVDKVKDLIGEAEHIILTSNASIDDPVLDALRHRVQIDMPIDQSKLLLSGACALVDGSILLEA